LLYSYNDVAVIRSALGLVCLLCDVGDVVSCFCCCRLVGWLLFVVCLVVAVVVWLVGWLLFVCLFVVFFGFCLFFCCCCCCCLFVCLVVVVCLGCCC